MSERNKDELSREEWLKHAKDASSKSIPGAKLPADEWEERALRGRSLLSDEEEARSLLNELDAAIDQNFGSSAIQALPKKDEPTLPADTKRKGKGANIWLSIAASALILVIAAWWLWPRTPAFEQSYSRHFSHLDNTLTITLMGAETTTDALIEALRPYNARRYKEAAQSIAQYLQTQKDTLPLHLYYGISLLESESTTEAIEQFQAVIDGKVMDNYRAAAEWYLGLAYVKSHQPEAAKRSLQAISKPDHPYYKQAKELLKEF